MARKTGYMDKEAAESAKKHKEYLDWLKAARAKSRAKNEVFLADIKAVTKAWDAKEKPQIAAQHKETTAAVKKLAAESKARRKKFIASNREYAKTLGKFDDSREKVRKIKY